MCIKQHSPLRLQKRVLLGLSILFYVALTNLAFNDVETRLRSLRVKINFYPFAYSCFRNPPGVNFIHATCDLLLLGLSILF